MIFNIWSDYAVAGDAGFILDLDAKLPDPFYADFFVVLLTAIDSKQEVSDQTGKYLDHQSILETIKTTLASGEDVLISGFGKFYVKEKGKRKGRNPQTGGELMLRGRKVVGFKSSRVLKGKVDGKKRSQ